MTNRLGPLPRILAVSLWSAFVLVAFVGLPGAQESSTDQNDAYVIGIADVLKITVWKNPELDQTAPVRPDGRISVPLVGEVEVAGKTPAEVQRLLTESYEDFVAAPAVSVLVQEINSHRIFIVGEVGSSGEYDIVQPTTLMQALAMAGGLTDFAKKDRVILLRRVDDSERRSILSIKSIESGKRLEDNIYLIPGDTIIVP